MRATTIVCAKFESKGFPDKTSYVAGSLREIILGFGQWILGEGVYLSSTINVTIAKTKAELEIGSRKVVDEDMAAVLERMIFSNSTTEELG